MSQFNWDDVEKFAQAAGIPVNEAAAKLGVAINKFADPKIDAIRQMYQKQMLGAPPPAPPSGPPPDPSRNDATLANQPAYEQQLSDRLKKAGQGVPQNQVPLIEQGPNDNTGLYAHGGRVDLKPNFSHLQDMMKKHKKAGSELAASRNPEKFMEKMKNPSIKGLKGVAFNAGGKVKK
jgi:hypothetical protein